MGFDAEIYRKLDHSSGPRHMKDSFYSTKKAGIVLQLTGACYTIWYRCFTWKLFHLISVGSMICFMQPVYNRSFTITTKKGLQNRLRCFNCGVPRGLVLPLNFLTSIYDLPVTVLASIISPPWTWKKRGNVRRDSEPGRDCLFLIL